MTAMLIVYGLIATFTLGAMLDEVMDGWRSVLGAVALAALWPLVLIAMLGGAVAEVLHLGQLSSTKLKDDVHAWGVVVKRRFGFAFIWVPRKEEQ